MLYFLNAALTVILALYFTLIGIFSFLIGWSDNIQVSFISLIRDNFWFWNLVGLGFILIAAALFSYTYLITRKSYLTAKTGANTTSIDESVINSYLQTYFENLFPNQQIPYRLLLKKRKMQIVADLPYVPLQQQKSILSMIENDLKEILSENFGYNKTLQLSLSFDNLK